MPSHLNEYEFATNPEVKDKITTLGSEMNNNWSPSENTAYPNRNYLLRINRKFRIGNYQIGNTYSINLQYCQIRQRNSRIHDYSIYDYAMINPHF